MSPLYILLLIPAIVVAIDLKPYDQTAGTFFDDIDTDDDGKVDLAEVQAYFKTLDTNGDAKLDAQEFKAFIDAKHPIFTGHDQLIYKYFDKNHDNSLDIKDLEGLVKEGDRNNDGTVTRVEFINHFKIVVQLLEAAVNAGI